MSNVAPIEDEERETARKHFMPGVMREHGGIMRNGSVMQAYEARLTELEAENERLMADIEAILDYARDVTISGASSLSYICSRARTALKGEKAAPNHIRADE